MGRATFAQKFWEFWISFDIKAITLGAPPAQGRWHRGSACVKSQGRAHLQELRFHDLTYYTKIYEVPPTLAFTLSSPHPQRSGN